MTSPKLDLSDSRSQLRTIFPGVVLFTFAVALLLGFAFRSFMNLGAFGLMQSPDRPVSISALKLALSTRAYPVFKMCLYRGLSHSTVIRNDRLYNCEATYPAMSSSQFHRLYRQESKLLRSPGDMSASLSQLSQSIKALAGETNKLKHLSTELSTPAKQRAVQQQSLNREK